MDLEVKLTTPTPETIKRMTALYRRVYREGEANNRETLTAWAFGDHPLGRSPLLTVADNERILAVRGGIPWRSDLGDGEPRRVVQLGGTVVDESLRRQGFFTQMVRNYLDLARQESVPLLYNISTDASRAGYERLGWKYVRSLRSLILPTRPIRTLRHLLLRSPESAAQPQSQSHRLPDFESVAGLLDQREAQLRGLMHTVYDRDFMAWRFRSDHIWHGDPSAGYVVYSRRTRRGLSEMLVGDIWPGNASARKLLLGAIRYEKPDVVVSWTTTQHPLYSNLRKMGFMSRPGHALNLGLRRPDGDNPPSAIALMAADIDTF